MSTNGLASTARPARPERDLELAIVIAACHRPLSGNRVEQLRELASGPVRWRRLARLAERHRVAGLVYDALSRAELNDRLTHVPELAELARRGSVLALRLAHESVRLQAQFDAAGIDNLVLKGAPVGILAFDDPGLKHCWDIDLLVRPDAALPARRLLDGLGYALIEPAGLDETEFSRFCGFAKEAVFRHPNGLAVELHWFLVDPPSLLLNADPFPDYRMVMVGGRGTIRTLSDRLQLAYLASHGQRHGWSRLKWIADVNGLLAGQPPEKVAAMIDDAGRLGAGCFAQAAVALCDTLFGREEKPQRVSHPTLALRAITAINRHCVAGPYGGSGVPPYSGTNALILLSVMLGMPDWRGRWGFLATLWNRPVERARGRSGIVIGYSLRRLIGLIARLPNRLANDRAAHRAATIRAQQD